MTWKPPRASLSKIRESLKRDLEKIVDVPSDAPPENVSPLTREWHDGPELPASAAKFPPGIEPLLADPTRRCEKYLLTERIGQGASGDVWKSWDLQLHRWAAVKMLKFRNPHAISRFIREARAAARITHPNLVAVYGTGTFHGIPYIAMQLAEGTKLKPKGMGFRRAAEVVRDAARGVECAHQAGIVHRDLKPDNFLIDASGRVMVTDFGLAHLEQDERPGHATAKHVVVGTPAFMSPEQASGEIDRVGPSSDIFSLGATLYFLVSGVYASESLVPIERSAPAIPRDLAAIISKALLERPVERYATAGALGDDLDRFLKGEPVVARPAGAGEKLARSLRKNRPAVVATFALLAGIVGWVFFAAAASKTTAAQQEQQKREARRRLVSERLEPIRLAIDQWEYSGKPPAVPVYDKLRADLGAIQREFPESAPTWLQTARLHWIQQEFEKGEGVATRVLELRDPEVEAAAYYYRSRIRLGTYLRGLWRQSAGEIERRPKRTPELEGARRLIIEDLESFQKCRSVAGDDPRKTYVEGLLAFQEATTPEAFRAAAKRIERALSSPTISRWEGYHNLGEALFQGMESAGAVDALTQSIDSHAGMYINSFCLRASVFIRLAHASKAPAEREKLWDRAMADYDRILERGPDPFIQANRHSILLDRLAFRSATGEDVTSEWEALNLRIEEIAKEIGDSALVLHLLGRAWVQFAQDQNGRDRDCRPAAKKSIRALERGAELDPSYAGTWMLLGSARVLHGLHGRSFADLERAAMDYTKAIEIKPEAEYLLGRGIARQFASKFRKDSRMPYEELLQGATNDTMQVLAADGNNSEACINLAWCYMQRGEWELAARSFRKAEKLDPSSLPRYEDHLKLCDRRRGE